MSREYGKRAVQSGVVTVRGLFGGVLAGDEAAWLSHALIDLAIMAIGYDVLRAGWAS